MYKTMMGGFVCASMMGKLSNLGLTGRGKSSSSFRAYPVETHAHYMLGVHSNGRLGRTLDVVGVGDNRTGTVHSLAATLPVDDPIS